MVTAKILPDKSGLVNEKTARRVPGGVRDMKSV